MTEASRIISSTCPVLLVQDALGHESSDYVGQAEGVNHHLPRSLAKMSSLSRQHLRDAPVVVGHCLLCTRFQVDPHRRSDRAQRPLHKIFRRWDLLGFSKRAVSWCPGVFLTPEHRQLLGIQSQQRISSSNPICLSWLISNPVSPRAYSMERSSTRHRARTMIARQSRTRTGRSTSSVWWNEFSK